MSKASVCRKSRGQASLARFPTSQPSGGMGPLERCICVPDAHLPRLGAFTLVSSQQRFLSEPQKVQRDLSDCFSHSSEGGVYSTTVHARERRQAIMARSPRRALPR